MGNIIRVLHIDDSVEDRKIIMHTLSLNYAETSFQITECTGNPLPYLTAGTYDIILSENDIEGYKDLSLIQHIQKTLPDIPLIILTADNSVENAVKAMKLGVSDYLVKSAQQYSLLARLIQSIHLSHNAIPITPHHLLHDKMMDGFAFVTMNGVIIDSNPAFQQMTGYTAEELEHLTYKEITPEKWHDFEAGILNEQVLIKGFSDVYEKEYRKKDGILFPVEIRTVLVRNNKGESEGMWAIVRDLTERKLSEKLIQESEERFKMVFDNVVDGMCIYDEDADPAKRILIECNNRYAELAGRSREELLRRGNLDDLTTSIDPNANDRRLESLSLNKHFSGTFSWKRPDGKDNIIEYTGVPVLWYGKSYSVGIDRDVTMQKQAEQALKESEERLRITMEATGTAIWDWDLVNDRWYASPVYYTMLGYEPIEGAVDRSVWLQRIHPDDRSYVKAKIDSVLQERNTTYIYEARILHFDGKYRWLSVSGHVVAHDEYGKATRMLGTRIDITLRKQTEEALKQSEAFIKAVMDNLPLGVAVNSIEPIVKFEYINDNFAKFYRTTKDALLDAGSFWDVVYEDADFRASIEKRILADCLSMDPERMHWEEIPIKRDGNETTYISAKNTFIPGKPLMISVVWDVTDYRRAKENLRLSEEKLAWEQFLFKTLIENIPDKIYFKDVESRFIRINKAMADLLKLDDPLKALGKTDKDFYNPVHSEEAMMDEQNIIKTGMPVVGKEELESNDNNNPVWVSTTKMPLKDPAGNIIGTFGISRDISMLKRAEDELLRAKEKAEENDRLKTAFLHNISHEIRTPMNAIMGFSGFLSDPKLSSKKRQHFIDIIIKSSNQLLSIITDIVSIATIEAGQEDLHENEVNVNVLCRLLYEQFISEADHKQVALRYHTQLADDKANIVTDDIKLTQVLTNLIGNALKFTKCGHIEFGYHLKKANELEFYIEDTGIGIAEEMFERIFDRFRQVDYNATRKFGGSGLGLSISKAYIELLGGKIWLKSAPGKGSVFYFTLPLNKAVDEKHTDAENEVSLIFPKTTTILVAEDNDTNFILIEEYLSTSDITILRARDGNEAVEICKSRNIDLLLMDLKMPNMDGYEAARQIKKLFPLLPVIAQTAYSQQSEKEKALLAGFDHFITKPIKQDDLKNILLKYLGI